MSLKRNFNNVVLDEYFFYEYQRCQFRAANFSSKNQVRKTLNVDTNSYSNVRCKQYIHYDESLKYLILSNIYMASSNKLIEGAELNLDHFKKMSAVIIEKEIETNKKRLDKGEKHYDKIRKEIIKELPGHFELINVYDFENSFKDTFIEDVPLKKYLAFIKARLRPAIHTSIPNLDQDGEPILKLKINSLSVENGEVNIVVTSIFNLRERNFHRNFIISILFNYFYYFKNEEMGKLIAEKLSIFDIEKFNIGKVIVYNPLNMSRHEITYDQMKNILSEMDLFRTLKNYIENYSTRTLDSRHCDFCENKIFCESRMTTLNKKALRSIMSSNPKNKTTEMI